MLLALLLLTRGIISVYANLFNSIIIVVVVVISVASGRTSVNQSL
jgi:hypothetical protein